MAWIYLFIAAICEVGWPVGMKLAAVHPAWRIVWILFAAISMTLSGVFLYLVQRDKIYQPPALAQVRLVPADLYNLSGTVLIYDSREDDLLNLPEIQDKYGNELRGKPLLHRLRTQSIPSRRTTYNYCLLPLSWCVELVDILLSLLATPIGWLADAIYEPLHNPKVE